MGLKVYDPNEVTIDLGGILVDAGFADGEFCRIEQEEQFNTYKGSDGEVTRTKTNDRVATITIILAQSSASNAALSALHLLDLNTGGGAGVVPILVRDRQGLSQFSSVEAWITKFPDESYDKEVTTREWIIMAVTNGASRFVGGN